ncbi:MAG: glycoside hydrolase family 97 N-terminal domain-containing protein [Acidobacteriia bacterium]|nr:glycoside hydrolase family 97 N-terminal domain-containing protein [Terriglobia bacterium]
MRRRLLLLFLLPSIVTRAFAQDERSVASPNGQLECRLFTAQPENGALFRLAYQVFFRGKRVIDTSFLGLNIRYQEPLLGENVGLTASRVSNAASSNARRYNSLIAEYMQNGSLGRRINVEVRAADDGIAFRYVIPRSTPLDEILIEDETTEFAFAQDGEAYPGEGRSGIGLSRIDSQSRAALPFAAQQSGVGWVAITELAQGGYPRAYLAHSDGTIMITRLASRPGDPSVVFEGKTPLTCPWRVVIVGPDRERLMQSEILRELKSTQAVK